LAILNFVFINYVEIGYIILMVSVRALVFLCSQGKPEKLRSAFSVGLRCANLLPVRTVWTLVACIAKRQGGVRHPAK